MMKNLTKFMAFAATAMMLFSCGSDDNISSGEATGDGSSVKATMGQLAADGDVFPSSEPSTRTTLGDQNEIKWVKGDSISISYGTDNRRFNVSAISEDGTSCTFAGTPLGDNQNATRYVAVYPYSMKATFSGTTVSGVTLPYVQNAVAGGFDPACNLMTASAAVGSNLAFKHVCSYFKVKPAFDCAGITITATNGEKLAGTFDVNVAEDGTPTVSNISSESDHVKLVGDIKGGETYYIAVLPGTYSSGIKVLLEKNSAKLDRNDAAFDWENSTLTLSSYSRSASSSITTSSAKIKSLGEMTTKNTVESKKTIDFVYMGDGTANLNANTGRRVLWAKYNLGAASEVEDGDYYAWGETSPKNDYSKNTYLCLNYYPETLDKSHDAAAANLGYGWHMPSSDEIMYLKEHNIFVCTSNYKEKPGFLIFPGNGDVKDYQKMGDGKIYRYENGCNPKRKECDESSVVDYVTKLSPDDNLHMFFVFAGGKDGTGAATHDAVRYWTNSRGKSPLFALNIGTELTAYYWGLDGAAFNIWSNYRIRYQGLTIRPVLEVEW